MSEGWIKLHRQLLESAVVSKPYYCHLWVVLLLKAAHKRSEFIWNNEKRVLRPGQLTTGRKKLSEQTGIPESTVERILTYFENEHQIEQQKTNKFRVIAIRNWEKYQGCEKENSKADSKWTANGQQADTYKNDKNEKKQKNYSPDSDPFRLSELLLKLILARKGDFKKPNLQGWAVHIERMIRLDNRKPGRIEAVISWCQQDEFWQDNILSTEKVRKQFDRLELAMEKSRKGVSHGSKIHRTDTQYRAADRADGCLEI
ncbi:MAG: hypothetical protein KAY65_13890 [Planctomycetes bacterium]|nr:hypothetical protein [Planctomycetota bacterium]